MKRRWCLSLMAIFGSLLLLGAPPPRCAAQTPAGWWKFDEGSGTTALDSSGNGRTGTLQGNAAWTAASEAGSHAMDFPGGGNVDVPAPVVDTGKSFTAACWVNIHALGGYQTFMSIDGTTVSGFYLQLRGDSGAFAFTLYPNDGTNSGPVVVSSSMTPQANVWHHVAGVYDAQAQTASLYVDGVLQQTSPVSGSWSAAGHTEIGRGFYNGGATDYVNAAVDDARLYGSALTVGQIDALAGSGPLPPPISVAVPVDRSGIAISPTLYGLMIEDISHSIDGGLYAETIRNRAFKDDPNSPVDWALALPGGAAATLSLDLSNPVPGTALTAAGRLDIASAGSGIGPGIVNGGYWGIPVRPSASYRASFYARAGNGFQGPLTLQLESASGTVYAQATIPAITTSWAKYTATLTAGPGAPTTASAQYVISAKGTGSVWFTQVSLMQPTYNDRPNGSRIDLMNWLAGMQPTFLRLPGGNYLEGNTIADRFEWADTIGDISLRPGHNDPWGYRSNDGFGILEYLEWCEDLHMQPVLAVYAGYSLNGTHVAPGAALAPYVQDALNEIQYATGSVSTTYGAKRAADGHPAPFDIRYVEIGNEDWFDGSGSYNGRFTQFYNAIKAAYPNLKLIATAHSVSSVTPDVYDDHYYLSPQTFQHDLHFYDGYDRNAPKVFVGEWASQEGNPTPDMNSALGDATWLLGLERNSDVVVLESYAPLLVNVNPGASQWGTNLIGFDALSSYASPSYYAQKLFGVYHGDTIVPATASSSSLIYDVSKNAADGTLFVKLVNPYAFGQPIDLTVTGETLAPSGTSYVLSAASPQATNTIADPNAVTPSASTFAIANNAIDYVLPPYSVAVLTVSAPNFSLSASPSSLPVMQGTSGKSTITVTPSGGFTGSVALSASGLPSGVTAGFSPASTTGASTLTLTASRAAASGLANVTITGTSGGLVHTAILALTVTLAPPASLTATPLSGAVGLVWPAVSGATLYTVLRANGAAGPYSTIARPAGTRFTDTDVKNGATYYYEVAPLNPGGAGSPTAPVAATPQAAYAPPPAPAGLMAASSGGAVRLAWTASARASQYSVKRAAGVYGPYVVIAATATSSYSDTSVTGGKLYYYAVSATNAYGASANSAPAGVLVK